MNERENSILTALREQGWTVYRDGWPDFLCLRLNSGATEGTQPTLEAVAVEVKSPEDKPSEAQHRMHEALERLGIPVAIARPGDIRPMRFPVRLGTRTRISKTRPQAIDQISRILNESKALRAQLAFMEKEADALRFQYFGCLRQIERAE